MNDTPPAYGPTPNLSLLIRGSLGGALMGLANLVPGVSGGTMLLASGIYPQFVQAVADVTRLRFTAPAVLTLAAVAASAGLSILLLAGVLKNLVVEHRWLMYSVFIGLTLGGLPLVWRLAQPTRRPVWWGAVIGFSGMVALAIAQSMGTGANSPATSTLLLCVAGLAGAAAMILPGVSGGYLLLLLGQYVPILSALDRFTDALTSRQFVTAVEIGLRYLTPVGVGVLVGVVVASNGMRILLERYRQPTLGVLLGLLVGAVVGLWPFREPFPPTPGATIKGMMVTEESIPDIDRGDYPTAIFRPSPRQIGLSLVLVGAGVVATWGLSRLDSSGADRGV